MKDHLGGTDKSSDYIMLPDHFKALRLTGVDPMITHCLEYNSYVDKNNNDPATDGEIKKRSAAGTIMLDKKAFGIERIKIPQKSLGETNQDILRLKI